MAKADQTSEPEQDSEPDAAPHTERPSWVLAGAGAGPAFALDFRRRADQALSAPGIALHAYVGKRFHHWYGSGVELRGSWLVTPDFELEDAQGVKRTLSDNTVLHLDLRWFHQWRGTQGPELRLAFGPQLSELRPSTHDREGERLFGAGLGLELGVARWALAPAWYNALWAGVHVSHARSTRSVDEYPSERETQIKLTLSFATSYDPGRR